MKRLLATTAMISSMLLSGCVQETKLPDATTMPTTTFSNQWLSMILPSEFVVADSLNNVLRPKDDNAFPAIAIAIAPKPTNFTTTTLLTQAQQKLKTLCGQTDSCGKMINNEAIKLQNNDGIKYTLQFKGTVIDHPETGMTNEYHYAVATKDNIFDFWTAAPHLLTPDRDEEIFASIIRTVTFR